MSLLSSGRSPTAIRVTSAGMDTLQPDEGEIIRLLVDPSHGIEWQLGYDPASSPAYPWIFLGGAKLAATIPTTTSPTAGSGLWVDLSNTDGPGPDVISPRDGIYTVCVEAAVGGSTNGLFHGVAAQIGAGSGDPANADAAINYNDRITSISRTRIGVQSTKGDRIRMLYRTDDADPTVTQYSRRVLWIEPARLA